MSAVAIIGGVKVLWTDASTNETGFVIYRSTVTTAAGEASGFEQVGETPKDTESFDDHDTDAGSTYLYQVASKNAAGTSAPVNQQGDAVGPGAGTDLNLALDGTGSITVRADGLEDRSCETDCSLAYASGTVLTLQAQGSAGLTFAGWTGACEGAGTCSLTLASASDVTARFRQNVLTIALDGDSPATVNISPGDSESGATVCDLAAASACALAYDAVIPSASINLDVPTGSVSDGLDGCDGSSTFCLVRVEGGVTVTATVRHPPVAASDAYDLNEDETKTVPASAGVLANDDDTADDVLEAVLDQDVEHGVLTLAEDGSFSYTPNLDFNGSDNFHYHVEDAYGNTSESVLVQLTVAAVNDVPVPTPQTVATQEDTPVQITLAATDVEGDAMTLAVADPPTNGALSGTLPTLTYTPAADYNGTDTFTFTASDAGGTSAPATVTIKVGPVDDVPVAQNDGYSLDEDTSLTVDAATGVLSNDSDKDDNLDHAELGDDVAHGTLTFHDDGGFTYVPDADFAGTDTFTYTAVDADGQTSNTATVTLTVANINDAPTADNASVTLAEDTTKTIALEAKDVDNDPLSYSIVAAPQHGDLTGSGATRSYTPDADYNGPDSFTFQANDGAADSNIATVTINVTAVNDPPTADAKTVTTQEDTQVQVTMTGSDPEGDPLTFSVTSGPQHGTLLGSGATRTYLPHLNYNGSDSFTYKANDDNDTSTNATVTITVTPVQDAPSAADFAFSTAEDTPKPFTLQGSDPDGDPLDYEVVSAPSNGSVSTGTSANRTYTPNPNYNGPDSFTYRVNDGNAVSNTATVTITVSPINDAPIANDDSYTTVENTMLTVTAANGVLTNDTDSDGNVVSAAVSDNVDHGALVLQTDGGFTYTPSADFSGTDTFTYTATDDDGGTSGAATVTITIEPTVVLPPARALVPTDSTCDDTSTGTECVVHVALVGSGGSYRGAAFDFSSTSFTLASSATGDDVSSDCLIGNGDRHVLVACDAGDAFGDGGIAHLSVRRFNAASSNIVISNVTLATTALARLMIDGGSLPVR